jgi:hypothetical protein
MKLSDAPAPYGTPRKAGIALDIRSNFDSITGLPDALLEQAARNVASRAHDATDAWLLLDVLGLLPAVLKGSL